MEPATIVILSALLVTLVSMFLVSKFKINIFGLDLSYSKADNANVVHQIVHLALDNQKFIYDNNNQILHNQMTYADGILSKITSKLELEVSKDKVIIVQQLVKEIIKDAIRENGFSSYGPIEFTNYVSNKTSILRQLYKDNIGETKYIESHDFSSLIIDLFSHSANCCNYWSNKISEAQIKYQKDYDELIKQIK